MTRESLPSSVGESYRILDPLAMDEVLRGIAREIHAGIPSRVALVGIRRRGVPLAERLALHLRELRRAVPVGEIGLKRYDDDLRILHEKPALETSPLPFEPSESHVILVDDVLFTGTTLFTASAHFMELGTRRMSAALLAERGRPDLPVPPTRTGVRLDVADDTLIEVHIPPFEDDEGVWLRRRRS